MPRRCHVLDGVKDKASLSSVVSLNPFPLQYVISVCESIAQVDGGASYLTENEESPSNPLYDWSESKSSHVHCFESVSPDRYPSCDMGYGAQEILKVLR